MITRPKTLYRTILVIWTDTPPAGMEIDRLASEAVSGGAFCSSRTSEVVTDPSQFPNTDFFGVEGYEHKPGDKGVFHTPYQQYADREGQAFTIVRVIGRALPMYVIRFEDGTEIEAFPEEVDPEARTA